MMVMFEDIMRGRVDLNQVDIDRGYAGSRRDPGADPPDMAGLRLSDYPLPGREPVE